MASGLEDLPYGWPQGQRSLADVQLYPPAERKALNFYDIQILQIPNKKMAEYTLHTLKFIKILHF